MSIKRMEPTRPPVRAIMRLRGARLIWNVRLIVVSIEFYLNQKA